MYTKQTTACNETAVSLIPSSFPAPSLSVQPADMQCQRGMQLMMDVVMQSVYTLPKYMFFDLPNDAICSVARFRLAHSLLYNLYI